MTRFLREPLLHVVLFGAALFAFHRWVAPPRARQEIVVSADALAGMQDDFRRRTGRMPSAAEEQTMIDEHVHDEELLREGLALGLDRGDSVVRRRVIQKMALLLESGEPVPSPSDAELERYLAAHADRYASPDRVSLDQVFVVGEGGEPHARELRSRLEQGVDPTTLGDPVPRGRNVRLRSQDELTGVFGAPFATAVIALPEGSWSEPIRSSFGWHVVRVSERRRGTMPALAEVRTRVDFDWRADRRAELDREARARLHRQYVVRVERHGS